MAFCRTEFSLVWAPLLLPSGCSSQPLFLNQFVYSARLLYHSTAYSAHHSKEQPLANADSIAAHTFLYLLLLFMNGYSRNCTISTSSPQYWEVTLHQGEEAVKSVWSYSLVHLHLADTNCRHQHERCTRDQFESKNHVTFKKHCADILYTQ